ncbi:hypothetical protein B0O99DRAFT_44591 [Bisporella sp. PMI_857]|nr:hypothetical protein B0O99DRAFT_44591 [Bisporella sp. PMI_857]
MSREITSGQEASLCCCWLIVLIYLGVNFSTRIHPNSSLTLLASEKQTIGFLYQDPNLTLKQISLAGSRNPTEIMPALNGTRISVLGHCDNKPLTAVFQKSMDSLQMVLFDSSNTILEKQALPLYDPFAWGPYQLEDLRLSNDDSDSGSLYKTELLLTKTRIAILCISIIVPTLLLMFRLCCLRCKLYTTERIVA